METLSTIRVVGTIRGDPQAELGTIRWDGAQWVLKPTKPRFGKILRSLLADPIPLAGHTVTSDDPAAFLDALPKQYRGIALRCIPEPPG